MPHRRGGDMVGNCFHKDECLVGVPNAEITARRPILPLRDQIEFTAHMFGHEFAAQFLAAFEKFFGIDIPTGGKSLREVEEFIIHPNLVKSLRVGKCVCVKKYPSARAYLVDVASGV